MIRFSFIDDIKLYKMLDILSIEIQINSSTKKYIRRLQFLSNNPTDTIFLSIIKHNIFFTRA